MDIINALWSVANAILVSLVDAMLDLVIWVTSLLLTGVISLIGMLVTPCCVAVGGLVHILMNLPPFALHVISHMDFSGAMAILSCGFVFRMSRKIITLFQW